MLVVKKDIVQKDSNTTFVKVKLEKIKKLCKRNKPYSNTTFVKVKCCSTIPELFERY